MAIRGRFLLDRGFDLVDGPGGSEAAGGVAANAYGDFVAFAGLCVAQGEARAVTAGLDGTALASDPVVLADDAEGVGAVGEISCVSSRGFEQKEHRKLSSLSIGSAHAF